MSALIDVDQLRTFIAIVETGSFTKAAEVVHKTQSAVSMQMKRLEERLGKPIFARDGRASKLTEDGERLLDYARRIIKLNVEALHAFDDAELTGRVRLGLPDDYADRYLPEIMARFSRAYPGVELTVSCQPSSELIALINGNELDLAIVTSCDRRSSVGRRDYAVLLLLARMGLRAKEVASLSLDDVNWREGILLIRGKGGREDRMPLLEEVGSALASYLRRRRKTSWRSLFLGHHVPHGPLGSSAVTSIVRDACKRAELPPVGAHRLRHSAATTMLRRGATLDEIAQALRHRHHATTAIYAKVDHCRLRELAQPWPGGAA